MGAEKRSIERALLEPVKLGRIIIHARLFPYSFF
jgi:hypothetical protein